MGPIRVEVQLVIQITAQRRQGISFHQAETMPADNIHITPYQSLHISYALFDQNI